MKLPAELRLIIYELVLHDVIPILALGTPAMSYYACCGPSCARGALALLLTNKEVRAESSKAMMPSMLGRLESYRTRMQLVEQEWDELECRHCDNEDDYRSIQQQLGGLEEPMLGSHWDVNIVGSVHLAVSRAAKNSLP